MKAEYIIGIILLALVGVGGLVLALSSGGMSELNLQGNQTAEEGEPYVEIANPSGFVNTGQNLDGSPKPITIGEFVGKKVILVDFLTYSCINCQRTFPYLVAWYDKYKDEGLEIVGIHTPEFAFEHDIDNVRAAMKMHGITYPIVLDNDYATWNAYGNRYWPRKYLIDIHGNIVYDHIGEGAYDETEKKIQELLAQRAEVLGEDMGGDTSLAADSVPETTIAARSPETYFGASRNEYFANGMRGKLGQQSLDAPLVALLNRLYLVGDWNISQEYAEPAAGARILYRFNARGVYMVAEADGPVRVQVLEDGKPVTADNRGASVDEDGYVTIEQSDLYKLIEHDSAGEHLLELHVEGSGAKIYTFTFG